jgi:hypothetical protein
VTFKTVSVPLSEDVAASGTVVFAYPSGSAQADFDPAADHTAVISGAVKSSADSDFSLTFGASSVTFTNGSSRPTLPAGATLHVQMEEFAPDIVGEDVGFTNVDAGASGLAGSVDVFPATASKGKLALVAADSAGNTTTTLTNASQAAARTYTVPDAGASASFVMTAGAQTLAGVKTLSSSPVVPGLTGRSGGQLILRDNANLPLMTKVPAPGAGTDTETLTEAELLGRIYVQTPTVATTLTTPTGTEISAAVDANLAVGDSFLFTVINLGGAADDITFTPGDGVSVVGDDVVRPVADAGTDGIGCGTFLLRNSAANTWIAYRIS